MKTESKRSVVLKDIQRTLLIIFAAGLMATNIKSFVRAGGLLPGGFNGLSLLIQEIGVSFFDITIPFTLINLILNAVPVIICFKVIGKKFTMLSCIMIFLSSIFTDLTPAHPITYDILLTSIFGGIVNGAAICICLFAGATSGGTDFIAIYLSEKFGIDAFNYILIGNAVILIIAGFLFGWEKALYSIIFQFTSTQMLHVCYKRYKRNTLLIITEEPEAVADVISKCTRHGSTTFAGFGTYEKKPRTMVYSVVGSDEVKRVISMIKTVDERVFVNVIKTDSIAGNFYRKPND